MPMFRNNRFLEKKTKMDELNEKIANILYEMGEYKGYFLFSKPSIRQEISELRDDFLDLDNKVDALIDYLKTEYVEEKSQTGENAIVEKRYLRPVKKSK